MPIPSAHIRATVDAYLDEHPEEKDALAALLAVLDDAGDSIASRKEFRGHVTAGAVVLSQDGRVLTVEHKALKKWLLPGGHLDDSDEALTDAALRELEEETGISSKAVVQAGAVPLHIDVHTIPASDAKGEPEHQHFDFRFLFRTDAEDVVLQAEEVTGYSWQKPDMLTTEPLRSRVVGAACL